VIEINVSQAVNSERFLLASLKSDMRPISARGLANTTYRVMPAKLVNYLVEELLTILSGESLIGYAWVWDEKINCSTMRPGPAVSFDIVLIVP
jgi:hypothetical protein